MNADERGLLTTKDTKTTKSVESILPPLQGEGLREGSRHKPYPEYKPSGVEWLGEIPAGWEVKRLKYAMLLNYGDSLPNDTREDGDVPVMGSNGPVGSHNASNTLAPTIVVGRKGSYGKITYINQSCFAIDTTYFVDRRTTKADLRWLYYVLAILGLDDFSEDSAVPGLSREYVYGWLLPYPPSPEQRAIAAFLDRETARIDALVAKKERLVELLQEKRAALISHAVTKGLDSDVEMKDSGVEWLGEIPAHWEVKRLKMLTSVVTSGSRGWAQYYSDNGGIFLRIGNLSRMSLCLDLDDIQHVSPPQGAEGERTRVYSDDILISITADIGSIGLVPEDIGDAFVSQHIALARPIGEKIFSKWAGYGLLSWVGQRQFNELLYGGTKDGLGLDDVRNLVVLGPPLPEQRAIAAYLDRETALIDALVAKVLEAIDRLREYRTALISAAVTGKIDVRGVPLPSSNKTRILE